MDSKNARNYSHCTLKETGFLYYFSKIVSTFLAVIFWKQIKNPDNIEQQRSCFGSFPCYRGSYKGKKPRHMSLPNSAQNRFFFFRWSSLSSRELDYIVSHDIFPNSCLQQLAAYPCCETHFAVIHNRRRWNKKIQSTPARTTRNSCCKTAR